MPMSRHFEDFLTAYCAAEEDLTDTAKILRQHPDSELAQRVRAEIDTVISDRLLTLDDARRLMSRTFRTPAEAAEWLAARRVEWFGP
ncbi:MULTISPECIES: hypothetical protein [unclassified Amycolatopsis]|uniref:hypothetical protein n=1 Tax=unclassified Amycolatopsis TaxID=2618356 RepID=UPI0028745045|nr:MULTISPECIES: hypothetical protein [unclassified Amycolatopsis]MDS0132740.1 hypothetical protein [Amycolatopsis sp. 505]MDS0142435.1 hypothetical protein [Amycolatopsis sp. CM201R]